MFLVPAAVFSSVTVVEKICLIGSVLLLLIIELLNSSIEAAIDRISFDKHDLSKRAKDLGSAAVFLSLILVIGTYSLIFFQKLFI